MLGQKIGECKFQLSCIDAEGTSTANTRSLNTGNEMAEASSDAFREAQEPIGARAEIAEILASGHGASLKEHETHCPKCFALSRRTWTFSLRP